jgi:hypothetical protein
MITPNGYSKDLSLIPEGIALTLPEAFFADRGVVNYDQFKESFERYMRREDAIWNFRLTNLPALEKLPSIYLVYLIFDKHIQYQCNFVQVERNVSKSFEDSPDGKIRHFPAANWVLFTGPVIKPPHERPQKGFQGFRYTLKLW